MTTIKDISRACGVSPATVSKALNGYSEISKETVDLVRRTAKEMHYMPDAAARLLKTNISHNIGVLFEDGTMSGLTHEYFSLILNSVKREAEKLGYDITFISRYIGGQEVSFLEHCRYRRCDGVVIACVDFESAPVIELVRSEVPIVTIDYTFDNISCILSDNIEGARKLTDHLIEAGHRKIAFVHGEESSVTGKRLNGYYRALEEHGIPVREDYVLGARYHDPEAAERMTLKLLDLPDPPTCILDPDDFAGFGGINAIRERGLRIPEDISVAGYDGLRIGRHLEPRLTTIRQDTEKIGREAAENLIHLIEHPRATIIRPIVVEGELYEGETVGDISRDEDE